jgi:hypothetical protein
MTETTYTRAQVTAALGTMHSQLDEVTDTSIVDHLTTGIWRRLGSGPFTSEQVQQALNDEANELDPMQAENVYENSDTIRTQDVLNLAVNTALHLLDHPDDGLRAAITAQYGGDSHGPVYDPDSDDWNAKIPQDDPKYADALADEVLGWVS